MPPKPLATAHLHHTHDGDIYHVTLEVQSRSFDHPDPSHRSAAITKVALTELAPGQHTVSNVKITDHFGVENLLWKQQSGVTEGFSGITEFDSGHGVAWLSTTGIYDPRCQEHAAVDAVRLQTYRAQGTILAAFNYLHGPVTFAFDIQLASPPKAVEITLGLVGGNGGNPAQRSATLPDEVFVIHFP
ncbi:MAG TPA: hypothetical protein VK636_05955 [Gemmatimonadaceae bacterium]|nr:hypothetical protein [Gemmatimonadaceae bacterium]